jgi:hypothetical protein
MLFVYAAPDLAYELYTTREQHREGSVDAAAFMGMLTANVESDVPFLMAEADAVIYNWSGEIGYGQALASMADELGLRRLAAAA